MKDISKRAFSHVWTVLISLAVTWYCSASYAQVVFDSQSKKGSVVSKIHQAVEMMINESNDDLQRSEESQVHITIPNIQTISQEQCPVADLEIAPLYSRALKSRDTIRISCKSKKSWKRYLSIYVQQQSVAVLTAHPLTKGQIIQAQHLKVQSVDSKKVGRGYFQDTTQLIGKRMKKNVRPQQVITPNMIHQSKTIEEGDYVDIRSADDRISVTANGIALSSGFEGDRVLVKNSRSDKVLKGIVKQPGVVIVY